MNWISNLEEAKPFSVHVRTQKNTLPVKIDIPPVAMCGDV
jgi:hypothetical protein